MPKFDQNIQDVSQYLDLFGKIAVQNGYPESSWPLAFRAAVAGTKLESIAAFGKSYDDVKKEVLLAHGFTAEQLWRQLTNIKQGDESFRQLVWRATTKLQQFFKLAVTDTLSVDLILDTLLKYFVLEGCSDELRAHFLERKLPSISCEEFQEIGSSFQEAHRWEKSSEQYLFKSDESTTMNAWRVSTEETVSKLQKMSINDRRTYVFEKRLCFNCLLPGHRGSSCRSAKRCTRCNSKHHTLLHQNNNPKKPNEEAQVNMVSSHVDHHGIAKIG